MLRNKHIIAALIITPILSVLGYFAVDFLVSEKTRAAQAGDSYQLVARSSCRYASGHCVLANGDFKLNVKARFQANGQLRLTVDSAFPLDGSKVAVVAAQAQQGIPIDMVAEDTGRLRWHALVPAPAGTDSLMRLVVAADDSLYFGESELTFVHYETGFGEDFRGDKP